MTATKETIRTEAQTTANRGWTVMRVVIAVVILMTAAMKCRQLATQPDLSKGLLHARWFNIAVVEFELAFGIWSLAGLMPKLTWLVSVGCFPTFASVSFYKDMSGETSCGCFGAAPINP